MANLDVTLMPRSFKICKIRIAKDDYMDVCCLQDLGQINLAIYYILLSFIDKDQSERSFVLFAHTDV